MGLDMYLTAEIFAGQHFDPGGAFSQLDAVEVGFPKPVESYTLKATVCYWRKVNAVHAWFVREVQGGVDECQKSFVSKDQLQELRDICADVAARQDPDYAIEKLPPQPGFFFGSTDIDDYYWEDIRDTVRQLDRILLNPNVDKFDYYYRSSW